MANHPNRARSGHLPGHIRDTFLEAIEAFVDDDAGKLVRYEIHYRERLISIAEACRLVWNCTDILSGTVLRELQDCLRTSLFGNTYAAAAQAIFNDLRADGRVDAETDIARRQRYDALDAAWRDLEGWALSKHFSKNQPDPRVPRQMACMFAMKLVEDWRHDRLERAGDQIDELLEAVCRAEEALPPMLPGTSGESAPNTCTPACPYANLGRSRALPRAIACRYWGSAAS